MQDLLAKTNEVNKSKLSIEEINKLKSELMAQAFNTVEKYFHKESNTHIYYCEDMAHMGLKGCGEFPNEAFEAFQSKLSSLVESGPSEMLERWLKMLDSGAKQRQVREELQKLKSDESYQTPKRLRVRASEDFITKARMKSTEKDTSIVKVATRVLTYEVASFWNNYVLEQGLVESAEKLSELSNIIERDVDIGSMVRLSVKLPSDERAKLHQLAERLKVKESDLTRSFLSHWSKQLES